MKSDNNVPTSVVKYTADLSGRYSRTESRADGQMVMEEDKEVMERVAGKRRENMEEIEKGGERERDTERERGRW